MITMLVSGIWHGAGYQFIVFGLLHGLALVVNHWFRLRRAWWPQNLRFGPPPLALASTWAL